MNDSAVVLLIVVMIMSPPVVIREVYEMDATLLSQYGRHVFAMASELMALVIAHERHKTAVFLGAVVVPMSYRVFDQHIEQIGALEGISRETLHGSLSIPWCVWNLGLAVAVIYLTILADSYTSSRLPRHNPTPKAIPTTPAAIETITMTEPVLRFPSSSSFDSSSSNNSSFKRKNNRRVWNPIPVLSLVMVFLAIAFFYVIRRSSSSLPEV